MIFYRINFNLDIKQPEKHPTALHWSTNLSQMGAVKCSIFKIIAKDLLFLVYF